jgi:hypothetical protein
MDAYACSGGGSPSARTHLTWVRVVVRVFIKIGTRGNIVWLDVGIYYCQQCDRHCGGPSCKLGIRRDLCDWW